MQAPLGRRQNTWPQQLAGQKRKPLWLDHYRIEKLDDSVEIGDKDIDQEIKLKREWRSCNKPGWHPISILSPSQRRDAPPLVDY
jgi:hypothetical protein